MYLQNNVNIIQFYAEVWYDSSKVRKGVQPVYRKIYADLQKWKNSTRRKPLVLQGARQVGKTYTVNLFAQKEYSNYVYCNFEKEEALKDFFTSLDPRRIVKQLSLYKRKEIIPNHTLIIFDEVQACPQALTSLKYFNEEANEYHIIASGSLLGVSVNRGDSSFPVGKVDMITMYPMDFEEFLLAQKEKYIDLIQEIKEAYDSNVALPTPIHDMAIDLYKQYLYVGGMPEAVKEYVETKNVEIVRIIQKEILEAYFNDMGKYNKATEIPKTKLVFENISTQLSKENKKFQYKLLKTGARASLYEEAIRWICNAGISSQLFRLEQVSFPLESNKSTSDFKFFMGDVGLCGASQDVRMEDIEMESNDFEFRGGLAENYINNQLIANGLKAYYWTSKSDAEVDFITRLGANVIPIEVKSGVNTRSRSLESYAKTYHPKYAIRISQKNFGFENGIKSIPLYAAFCIK